MRWLRSLPRRLRIFRLLQPTFGTFPFLWDVLRWPEEALQDQWPGVDYPEWLEASFPPERPARPRG